MIRWW